MHKTSTKSPTAVVLADVPERVELREVTAALAQRRDSIAELDLEIESLTESLAAFESHYSARLAPEHHTLSRIEGLVGHFERWSELLAAPAAPQRMRRRAARLEQRRAHDVRARRPEAEESQSAEWVEREDAAEELKTAYRQLARRYHPDLARSEQERVQFSRTMARINELYRLEDLNRLLAMVEQARGAELDAPDLDVADQLETLKQRLEWFDAILENLRSEQAELEGSATCEMMRNVEQARAHERDLIEELRAQLRQRVERTYEDVREGAQHLEARVSEFNRRGALEARGRKKLDRIFDPYGDKKLIRIGLDALDVAQLNARSQDWYTWLIEQAVEREPLLRLVLLTHVAELSPFPLSGLETYDDVATRFAVLSPELSLERALVEADEVLEFGVRKATAKVAHTGLRFLTTDLIPAVAAALRHTRVKRHFKRVLSVLGKRQPCTACGESIFAVPLYKTRGLDDLRASVCPACGHTLESYWMPKGKDVQAVLNRAYLEFDLVSEWSFRVGRSSIALQLVPAQLEQLTVGDLKRLAVDALFARHDLDIEPDQVHLLQRRKRVDEHTPLEHIDERRFSLKLTGEAPMSVSDALAVVRHRVRNRFRGG